MIELYQNDGSLVVLGKSNFNNIAREIYGKVRTVLIIQKDEMCNITLSDFKGKSIVKFKILKKYTDHSFLAYFYDLCFESIKNYVNNKEHKDVYDIEFKGYEEWKNGMEKWDEKL